MTAAAVGLHRRSAARLPICSVGSAKVERRGRNREIDEFLRTGVQEAVHVALGESHNVTRM